MNLDGKRWFEVFGVTPDASEKEVKEAYRRLAKRFHPDKNPDDPQGAEDSFKRVEAAYDVYEKRGAADAEAYKRQSEKEAMRKQQASKEWEFPTSSSGQSAGSKPRQHSSAQTKPSSPPPTHSQRPSASWSPPSQPSPVQQPARGAKRSIGRDTSEAISAVIASGLCLIAWYWFWAEGLHGFRFWWNPVALVPVLVWILFAISVAASMFDDLRR